MTGDREGPMIATLFVAALFVGASQQSGSISGVIVDTTRYPIPGATLVLAGDDGVRRAPTDTNGRYRFDGLSPGRYRIEVSMGGFEAKAAELTVAPGAGEIWSGALLVAPSFGAASIERRLSRMSAGAARDCGRHDDTAPESALLRSLQCALISTQAGEAFTVVVQSTRDRSAGFGLQGAGDAGAQVFRYERGGLVFRAEPCPVSRLALARVRSTSLYEFTCR
jgi:hypothetical protein